MGIGYYHPKVRDGIVPVVGWYCSCGRMVPWLLPYQGGLPHRGWYYHMTKVWYVPISLVWYGMIRTKVRVFTTVRMVGKVSGLYHTKVH